MANNWWENLVVYEPDETASSEASNFATELDALDLAGEMDRVYNAAMDEIEVCTPQYIENAGKLLQELQALIPKTQLEANYNASPETNILSPSATIEIYNAYTEPVNLNNWRIRSAIEFDFPDVTIESGEYFVIADDPTDPKFLDLELIIRTIPIVLLGKSGI